jgi:hypothetical protein
MFLNRLGLETTHVQKKSHQSLFPEGIMSVEAGLKMLGFLHKLITSLFDGIDDMKEFMKIKTPQQINIFYDLNNKFVALASAYIIHVCTIDRIIKRSYLDMKRDLQRIGYDSIISDDALEMQKREKEIENFRWYRNKVFAHTSFSRPEKDSETLQHSSLMYYGGNFFMMKKTHLALGGGIVIIDKQEEIPPTIDIIEEHENTLRHFTAWEEMFVNILGKISDKEELKRKLEEIQKK